MKRDSEEDIQAFIRIHLRKTEALFKSHWSAFGTIFQFYEMWSRQTPVGQHRFESALRRAGYQVVKFGQRKVDADYSSRGHRE